MLIATVFMSRHPHPSVTKWPWTLLSTPHGHGDWKARLPELLFVHSVQTRTPPRHLWCLLFFHTWQLSRLGEDISTSLSCVAAMLRSAVWRVRSHRPHYATPDTCEAFATLFVLVCRRTPPVPPIKATCHKPDMQLCWSRKYSEVYVTGFGMDLRTYCIVHI